jgi:hypothetical protein
MFVRGVFPAEVLENEAKKKAAWREAESARLQYWHEKTDANLRTSSAAWHHFERAYEDHRQSVVRAMTAEARRRT